MFSKETLPCPLKSVMTFGYDAKHPHYIMPKNTHRKLPKP